jgi:hypothetical protein
MRLVDEADVYLGIFGHRYGKIPDGHSISTTEMEHDRAVKRSIPRLIFIIDPAHWEPSWPSDADPSAAARLQRLKDRIRKDDQNVTKYFSSPEHLGSEAILSLVAHTQRDATELHNVVDLPVPPKEYVAHRYSLMQVQGLIGRCAELDQLTDWIKRIPSEQPSSPVMVVVAVGGMGKSALAWKWFEELAPNAMNPLAGRAWWSFYESDARFENFVSRTVASVSRRPLAHVQGLAADEQIRQLLNILHEEPFLLVLDGLERLVLTYDRLDASRMSDEALDEQTAHIVPRSTLPKETGLSLKDLHRLRKASDIRAGRFLEGLLQVRSRILITTRLAPAELQIDGFVQRPGSVLLPLLGLKDADALALWRARKGQVSDAVL